VVFAPGLGLASPHATRRDSETEKRTLGFTWGVLAPRPPRGEQRRASAARSARRARE
jgi:hypothetical protein